MGIMDFFSAATNQQQAAAPVVPPTNGPAAAPASSSTNGLPANPAVGPDGKMPGTNQEPVNPIDVYNKMWENTNTNPELAPEFKLDPKVLEQAASSLDFTRSIPAELMQRATSGESAAIIEMMNLVGRQAYQASLSHSSTLTDKFVAARSTFDAKGIGSSVKENLVNQAISSIPNASHPVIKAQLIETAQRFQKANPDATPQQVADAAKKYVSDLASALNPASADTQQSATSGDTDWDKFFN